MPGIGGMKDLKNMKVDEKEIARLIAIVDSMTEKERNNYMIINGVRRRTYRQGLGHAAGGCEQAAEAVRRGSEDDEAILRAEQRHEGSWGKAGEARATGDDASGFGR